MGSPLTAENSFGAKGNERKLSPKNWCPQKHGKGLGVGSDPPPHGFLYRPWGRTPAKGWGLPSQGGRGLASWLLDPTNALMS